MWMMGTNTQHVNWPKCGEIDVVENQGTNIANVQGSLHSGSDETQVFTFINPGAVTNFHTYVLDWATNSILWYVDGHLYETQTNWSDSAGSYPVPFNQPFFMLLNLAVGGNYLGNPSTNAINANAIFPGILQIDYVRVYNPINLVLSVLHSHPVSPSCNFRRTSSRICKVRPIPLFSHFRAIGPAYHR